MILSGITNISLGLISSGISIAACGFRIMDIIEYIYIVSRIFIDTFSLDSHLGIVDHYCRKVAPWQERW